MARIFIPKYTSNIAAFYKATFDISTERTVILLKQLEPFWIKSKTLSNGGDDSMSLVLRVIHTPKQEETLAEI